MKKWKVLIIDDEKPGRDNLQAILTDYFDDISIVGQAENIDQAKSKIFETKPDFIFLDVELGSETGLDLLSSIPDPEFEVIFVTAYEEYAVKAFRTKATDYLLKPIDIDELRDAILKVKSIIELKESKLLNEQLQNAVDTHSASNKFLRINAQDGVELISYSDILYLQSISYYTKIVMIEGREILTSKTLKDYETQMKDLNFYRIHNSYMINLTHLKGIVSKETYFAKLVNDTKISISRRRKDDFLKYLETFKEDFTEF